ncbi:glycosyltransferase family 4 protein [Capnocytophaga sp. oral taxon 338]|uniref:glycosyltransferase family 4 protein n=1 Tax=Capnocytophaga sp. oral taxon 338 TaxID=710239 RepID=UPI000682FFD5|nr:MraY family glycosyltransferase [Capnocytophaga sp. oral taxon 338]
MQYVYSNLSFELLSFFVVLQSFIVSYLVIPRIIAIVKIKNLMDNPNRRSSHKEKTPTMGGVAFFASLLSSFYFLQEYDTYKLGLSLVIGLLILFYIGVKDDLIGVAPRTKIIGQILAFMFVIDSQELSIMSLDGFLGVYELPLWISYFLGVFIIIAIVNAYNLIDGINGSASMLGIMIFSIFSFIFYQTKDYYFVLLSLSCIGCLLAFLRYNISKTKNIFMGDTGSLLIGLIIGICTLRFLNLSVENLALANIKYYNKYVLIFIILFIPFVDTMRVFLIRIFKHRSPFFADRNHIHHIMIDYMKLSHIQASLVLTLFNFIVFILFYIANLYLSTIVLFILFILFIIGTVLLVFYYNRSFSVRRNKQKIQKILDSTPIGRKRKLKNTK